MQECLHPRHPHVLHTFKRCQLQASSGFTGQHRQHYSQANILKRIGVRHGARQALLCDGRQVLKRRRTQHAADDKVGAPPIPKNGYRIRQESIQRLDHPWHGAQTCEEGHLAT